MINFKLRPERPWQDDTYDFSRPSLGYSARMTDDEVYQLNRGIWVLGPRAANERYATFSYEGTVRVVVEIHAIDDVPPRTPSAKRRKMIQGRVLAAGHPVYDAVIGARVDDDRNPVTYSPDPGGDRSCACGCGETVTDRLFLAGHDQRAVRERIARRWGTTVKFLEWFDATEESQ